MSLLNTGTVRNQILWNDIWLFSSTVAHSSASAQGGKGSNAESRFLILWISPCHLSAPVHSNFSAHLPRLANFSTLTVQEQIINPRHPRLPIAFPAKKGGQGSEGISGRKKNLTSVEAAGEPDPCEHSHSEAWALNKIIFTWAVNRISAPFSAVIFWWRKEIKARREGIAVPTRQNTASHLWENWGMPGDISCKAQL